jgi:hypothetical protein
MIYGASGYFMRSDKRPDRYGNLKFRVDADSLPLIFHRLFDSASCGTGDAVADPTAEIAQKSAADGRSGLRLSFALQPADWPGETDRHFETPLFKKLVRL